MEISHGQIWPEISLYVQKCNKTSDRHATGRLSCFNIPSTVWLKHYCTYKYVPHKAVEQHTLPIYMACEAVSATLRDLSRPEKY